VTRQILATRPAVVENGKNAKSPMALALLIKAAVLKMLMVALKTAIVVLVIVAQGLAKKPAGLVLN